MIMIMIEIVTLVPCAGGVGPSCMTRLYRGFYFVCVANLMRLCSELFFATRYGLGFDLCFAP